MPPPNPNRLARRYMGLLKAANARHKDRKAFATSARELLAAYEAERAAMVAGILEVDAAARASKAKPPA